MEIEKLLDIIINRYIEEDILRLDLSDSTKNHLKRDLRKLFKDEDFIYDLENSIKFDSIPKSVIRDKITERQFELQQEYEDFENDIRLNTLIEILGDK